MNSRLPEHKRTNMENRARKLARKRKQVLKSHSDRAVDRILEDDRPAELIQSFPDQDLYMLMHTVGQDDFVPVLSLAASEQWEYILDMDTWQDDRLDVTAMTTLLDLLFRADPQRLMRWMVKEKPEVVAFYLSKHLQIIVREHDEMPPDDETFITFDDKFYFKFPYVDQEESEKEQRYAETAKELILHMFQSIAEMDLSVFHGLLLETQSILGAETEEEQYRLKNARLSEKGFLPPHEAVGIYQDARLNRLRKRKRPLTTPLDPDLPQPPLYPLFLMDGDNVFTELIRKADEKMLTILIPEFASLVNKTISADRIKVRRKEDIENAVKKTCAYLSVGLEIIGGKKLQAVVENCFLEDIFRKGAGRIFKLKQRMQRFYRHSYLVRKDLPLSFLGEKWFGIAGGLLLDRPLYYDNYVSGELYRDFSSLKEVDETREEVEKMAAVDGLLAVMDPFREETNLPDALFSFKTLLLTCWARDRLDLDAAIVPIPFDMFKPFFKSLFSGTETIDAFRRSDFSLWLSSFTLDAESDQFKRVEQVAADLFDELQETYGCVNERNLDPMFIQHFYVVRQT